MAAMQRLLANSVATAMVKVAAPRADLLLMVAMASGMKACGVEDGRGAAMLATALNAFKIPYAYQRWIHYSDIMIN